ncbi:hypothetical protein K437DRAFT_64618 [Tilletiaria anomala UBC 951]|uniref:Uncharacterized protein n=1 Tax=Tilletiaria anomala (strain ATCC 24038 / CBS 436.72 / UBC 951) TaxID=1037660 RepID=A0A066V6P9_TILAU|nr:uncharacterized protein K437DRAFT_64618 [Tilletiaria anomala UBC 951]KDN35943.1 hypothetical protein K437DRAFT_64618 [Tilletiaria anomala UBC 951]
MLGGWPYGLWQQNIVGMHSSSGSTLAPVLSRVRRSLLCLCLSSFISPHRVIGLTWAFVLCRVMRTLLSRGRVAQDRRIHGQEVLQPWSISRSVKVRERERVVSSTALPAARLHNGGVIVTHSRKPIDVGEVPTSTSSDEGPVFTPSLDLLCSSQFDEIMLCTKV